MTEIDDAHAALLPPLVEAGAEYALYQLGDTPTYELYVRVRRGRGLIAYYFKGSHVALLALRGALEYARDIERRKLATSDEDRRKGLERRLEQKAKSSKAKDS